MIPLPFTLLFWVLVYTPFLCFLSREDPLTFVGELVWWCWILSAMVVLNSLSFCLSVKLFISPSYLNEILAGYSNLGCRFFSFITLSMSCHFLLAWRLSIERSAVILMGIPLCVICCFSLAAFNIVLCVWSLLIWLICVLGHNYRVLICCTCHFQSGSLCLFWLSLSAVLFSV